MRVRVLALIVFRCARCTRSAASTKCASPTALPECIVRRVDYTDGTSWVSPKP